MVVIKGHHSSWIFRVGGLHWRWRLWSAEGALGEFGTLLPLGWALGAQHARVGDGLAQLRRKSQALRQPVLSRGRSPPWLVSFIFLRGLIVHGLATCIYTQRILRARMREPVCRCSVGIRMAIDIIPGWGC